MAIKSRRIGEQVESNTLGRIRVQVPAGSGPVAQGDLLSVTGTNASGGFLQVGIADANVASVLKEGMKLVAAHDIADNATGIAVSWIIVAFDTSGTGKLGAVNTGDLLYLSGTGTSTNTLAASPLGGGSDYNKVVGQVLIGNATSGKILLCPSMTSGI